jgi:hypothetical protein
MIDDAKDEAMKLLPEDLMDGHVKKVFPLAVAGTTNGFVTWSHLPVGHGTSYVAHKQSIIDSFELALSYCFTKCHDEWLVLGPQAVAIVRTIPQFVSVGRSIPIGNGLYRIGGLGIKVVYAFPKMENSNDFFVGTEEFACQGRVV